MPPSVERAEEAPPKQRKFVHIVPRMTDIRLIDYKKNERS